MTTSCARTIVRRRPKISIAVAAVLLIGLTVVVLGTLFLMRHHTPRKIADLPATGGQIAYEIWHANNGDLLVRPMSFGEPDIAFRDVYFDPENVRAAWLQDNRIELTLRNGARLRIGLNDRAVTHILASELPAQPD